MNMSFQDEISAGIMLPARGEQPNAHEAMSQNLVAERLWPQVGEIIAHAPPGPAWRPDPAVRQVRSPAGDPLAAIIRLLRAAARPYLLLVPGDAVRLPHNLAARLLLKLGDRWECAVSDDGIRIEPLYVMLSRNDCLPKLERYHQAGGRGAYRWLEVCNYRRVDFSDSPSAFISQMPPAALNVCVV